METKALRDFTREISPDYTVSFHTKGEEIYWRFYQSQEAVRRDRAVAEKIAQTTGYPLADAKGSAGGYKDWCIQTFKIPSFTIEVGKDEFLHPLGMDALADILEKNTEKGFLKSVLTVVFPALTVTEPAAKAVAFTVANEAQASILILPKA